MREQLQAGLNMCVAGIPWWTSDIGGFLGGNIKDEHFQELLVRWFAWGAFCPVFRMHGERSPWYEREQEFINNVRQLTSGQDNEVWSFGEENYKILTKYLFIRERLRPYIRECMKQASETGAPVMRPLFFDFAEDKQCWNVEDAYMFGIKNNSRSVKSNVFPRVTNDKKTPFMRSVESLRPRDIQLSPYVISQKSKGNSRIFLGALRYTVLTASILLFLGSV